MATACLVWNTKMAALTSHKDAESESSSKQVFQDSVEFG